jgi:hypothetical protein
VWGRETFHFFKNSPPHTSLFGGNEIQFPFREKGYLSLEEGYHIRHSFELQVPFWESQGWNEEVQLIGRLAYKAYFFGSNKAHVAPILYVQPCFL